MNFNDIFPFAKNYLANCMLMWAADRFKRFVRLDIALSVCP